MLDMVKKRTAKLKRKYKKKEKGQENKRQGEKKRELAFQILHKEEFLNRRG